MPLRSEKASGCWLDQAKDRAAGGGDAVDEEGLIAARAAHRRLIADGGIVSSRIAGTGWHSRISASQDDREVAAFRPRTRSQRVDGEILHGEIAGFDIDEQGRLKIERPEL